MQQDAYGNYITPGTGWGETAAVASGGTPVLQAAPVPNQQSSSFPTGNQQLPGFGATLSANTTTGGGSTVDPGLAALLGGYGQSINNTQSAIDRLPGQVSSGNSAIDASFQNALNQLLLSKNRGQTAYGSSKLAAGNDYVGAKNTIGSNAGATLTGIQRLLGSRGAGGGSAATLGAPGIVTRNATLQRGDASKTFGENSQALDTNWNNFLTDYTNEVSSAGNQRDQQKQSLQQTSDTNRATLLQSLASLVSQRDQANGGNGVAASQPYLDNANALLDRTANYTTTPIDYKTGAYVAPTAASYSTSPTTPTYNGSSPANDYFSPFLASLLGKKQTANVAA